ncbi:MAG: glycosyltransferase family 2 protein [bacterium]|nr:MAG: glycosyltransferase family 2 protein [bacterium]
MNHNKKDILKPHISAVIVYGGNYDKMLFEKAKKSVSWCGETVLIEGKEKGFSDWRNEGLRKAKGEWILYLDSDEEVTNELKKEILQLIENTQKVKCYAIPRQNIIFSKEFKHSGQYPDYQIRLFKKENLIEWAGDLHEQPKYIGRLGYLKNCIVHHKNMTVSQMIEKTNKWSEIEAKLMFDDNHPKMNMLRFFTAGFREFILRFVKQKAFLDGREGVVYGIYQIYSRLISYSKLWEMQIAQK